MKPWPFVFRTKSCEGEDKSYFLRCLSFKKLKSYFAVKENYKPTLNGKSHSERKVKFFVNVNNYLQLFTINEHVHLMKLSNDNKQQSP